MDISSLRARGRSNVTVSLSFDGDRAMTTRDDALPRRKSDAPACLLSRACGN